MHFAKEGRRIDRFFQNDDVRRRLDLRVRRADQHRRRVVEETFVPRLLDQGSAVAVGEVVVGEQDVDSAART